MNTLPPGTIRFVPHFPDYIVSTDGIVWSRKVSGSRTGRIGKWKELRPVETPNGYLRVTLHDRGKPTYRMIHWIVLDAFVGPCHEGMEARHLDDNPKNNVLSNLAWGTKAENYADAIRNGKAHVGEKQWLAKLTNDQVREIRRLRAEKVPARIVADQFGITRKYVNRINCREIWKHI